MTKISTKPTPTNITTVLDILKATPGQLYICREHVDSPREPLAEGERSLVATVAHLINCDAQTTQGIYLALLRDTPTLLDLHPERDWGKLLQVETLDCDELLAYFRVRRLMLMAVLERLSDDAWTRSVQPENKKRTESVYYLARSLALHEQAHVEELQTKGDI